MKRIFVAALAAVLVTSTQAQPKDEKKPAGLTFTTVCENPVTPVKNQYRSGTCWCFSGIGFLESEAIRINHITDSTQYPDFSEMFVVSHSYQDRADKYVRLDGKLNFSAGSEIGDVMHVVKDYGLVPQSVQPGTNYGTELPVHGELDALTKAVVEAVSKNPNRSLSPAWKKAFQGVVDAYLGECPTEFTYNGKSYTPASYRDSYGINPDNYVSLTSFTHHPFYQKVALELCDNWRFDTDWNVPIDEFMAAIDNAIMKGYTVAWASDVSERGFTRTGIAQLLPEAGKTSGSDQEKWVGKSEKKEESAAPEELEATQEFRQIGFDNKTTTDDHGMLIFGIAKDQYGNKYYMVKNSWGNAGDYQGIWYASEAFVKGKSISVFMHKDALPKDLAKKIGVK
ncbi:MAG: aminopeptidase C [Candidatus Cryptobacteroides sp.]|nr:C1 family peptidase [Bacteroidales bacterium]